MDECGVKSLPDYKRNVLEMLASQVLSSCEQSDCRRTQMSDQRRMEWLLGRAVAKQAVRELLARRLGLQVSLVDVEIMTDQQGRPRVANESIPGLMLIPDISIAHTKGVAVAAAVEGDRGVRIGVDVERPRPLVPGFAMRAFAPDEHQWLSGLSGEDANIRMIQLWCAKEAVAKALGLGFKGKPRTYVVRHFSDGDGTAEVEYVGGKHVEAPVRVLTCAHDNLIWALATLSRRNT